MKYNIYSKLPSSPIAMHVGFEIQPPLSSEAANGLRDHIISFLGIETVRITRNDTEGTALVVVIEEGYGSVPVEISEEIGRAINPAGIIDVEIHPALPR